MQRSKAIAFSVLALGVVALGVALYASREPDQPTVKPELSGHEWQLRDDLKLQSPGLDKPVTVRSHASSTSEPIIRIVGRRLEADGFRILLLSDGEDPWAPKDTWTLFADSEIVPSPENLCSLRERVKRVIEAEGARYEGWGPPAMR